MRCGALKENRKSLPVDASHELTVGCRRQAAKGVVHFDRVQAGGVIFEEFFGGNGGWIKIRFPAGIRPAGAAYEDVAARHCARLDTRRLNPLANDVSLLQWGSIGAASGDRSRASR